MLEKVKDDFNAEYLEVMVKRKELSKQFHDFKNSYLCQMKIIFRFVAQWIIARKIQEKAQKIVAKEQCKESTAESLVMNI